MKPRELPGALILGIPAAIVAHMLLFGQSHQLGGSLQDLFLSGALAAGVGFLVLFGSLAVAGATHVMGGSVLAAKLMRYLPGLGSLAGATATWYAAIEAAEPHHGGLPWPVVALAVASAAILVFFSSRSAVRAIARIAIAVTGSVFAPRTPAFVPRRLTQRAFGQGRIAANRRFARPPPSPFA